MSIRGASMVASLFVAVACGTPTPTGRPMTTEAAPVVTAPVAPPATPNGPVRTPRFLQTQPASEEPLVYFDGTFYGWRFAPLDVLREAGFEPGADPRDCDAQQYGATHATDLDFGVAYLPSGPRTEEVTKVACGDRAWNVTRQMFFEETGVTLTMTRARSASAAVGIYAPPEYVKSCEIGGRPAVCVHFLDDTTGRYGHPASIIVLEHKALDPYGTLFILTGEELPFAELAKVASSVSLD